MLQGLIEPHTLLDVPLVITPQGLQELETIAQLIVFGSPDPPLVSEHGNMVVLYWWWLCYTTKMLFRLVVLL